MAVQYVRIGMEWMSQTPQITHKNALKLCLYFGSDVTYQCSSVMENWPSPYLPFIDNINALSCQREKVNDKGEGQRTHTPYPLLIALFRFRRIIRLGPKWQIPGGADSADNQTRKNTIPTVPQHIPLRNFEENNQSNSSVDSADNQTRKNAIPTVPQHIPLRNSQTLHVSDMKYSNNKTISYATKQIIHSKTTESYAKYESKKTIPITAKTMASLMKLNHKKFLSKSSWSIRGEPKQTTRPVDTPIRRKGSDRFIHQMLDKSNAQNRMTSSTIATDANDVSNSSQLSSQDNQNTDTRGLRRMKGMSYSVTDLRQLSDKKDFDWLQVSDGFQQEIKDRRHE
ncbi:unnamed protein product, partial [Oppiella nova]